MGERAIEQVRPPKVLTTRIGLRAHDRGSRTVAAFLRDVGMEVVSTGPRRTASSVFRIALRQGVDVFGVPSLAGHYLTLPKPPWRRP